MAVNLEMGVDLSSFNSGINQAKAQISAFNATLKFAESSFKATGDAESAMISKTTALNGKLQAQKSMIQQYAKALEDMKKSGVDETSESYLKLQRQMILAQASMNDTQAALNGLNASQQEAATSADKLTQSVQGISKKVSLDQIIGGIDRITGGMERAAQKVVQFGEKLWNTIMDSARRADDTATMAEMYGIDLQTFKQMQALVAQGLDTSVDAMLSSQDKLKKGIGNGTKNVIEALQELGMYTKVYGSPSGSTDILSQLITEDGLDLMFRAGQAIMALGDSYEAEAKQESMAQALFGKSWKELVPLFDKYKTVDEYRAALNGVSVSSEEATLNAAELADKVSALQNSWTQLKDEIIGQVAPGLTQAAGALDSVLNTILEYLQTEEGKEMLNKLGESVAGLFDDLTKINPEDVVNNFVTVFEKLVSGLEWLSKNWGGVQTGLIALGGAFAGLRVAEGVLEFLRLINGAKGLFGGSGGAGGSGGGGDVTTVTGGGGIWKKAVTGLTALASKAGTTLTAADPTGLTAMILPALGDLTAGGQIIRDGGTVAEAAKAETKAVEQAAENAVKAWEDWGTQIIEVPKRLSQAVWKDLFGGESNPGDWSGENGDDWSVKVKPEAVDGSSALISEQIGAVTVPVIPVVTGGGGGGSVSSSSGGGRGFVTWDPGPAGMLLRGRMYANGIWDVPDTRLALLHPGEQVRPAREVASRNFSSNLYVESMIMNNGTDAAGLASAMAAAQRRTMSGYGS